MRLIQPFILMKLSMNIKGFRGRNLILFLITFELFLISGCEDSSLFRDDYNGNWVFIVLSSGYGQLGDLRSHDSVSYSGTITSNGGKNNLIIDFNANFKVSGTINADGTMICSSENGYYTGSGEFEEYCLLNMSLSHWSMSSRSYMTVYGEKTDKTNKLKQAPAAVTDPATALSISGATLNGIVNANFLFTDIFFEYGTSTEYGYTGTVRINLFSGFKDVQASLDLSGLLPSCIYHYRIKAVNLLGTTFGSDQVFTTGSSSNSIQDIDGNVYKTVQIGTQTWMAENIKTSRYADGTPVQLIISQDTWNFLTESDKAYCYYNNDTANLRTYGALYTWAAAVNGSIGSETVPSGIQGICPTAWHIPSEAEWNVIEAYLGGSTIVGGKMAETGLAHWASPNAGATNSSGFTALPGGYRLVYPYSLIDIKNRATFWTSTLYPTYNAIYYRYITNNGGGLYSTFGYKSNGRSVRCVKN